MGCIDCPIRGTNYCHKVNPMAKKYTRSEKTRLSSVSGMNHNYPETREWLIQPKPKA